MSKRQRPRPKLPAKPSDPNIVKPRERLFIAEMIRDGAKDGSQAQAAVRAGYSPKSARQIASRLMTKAHIRDAIALGLDRVVNEAGLERIWVLRRLMLMADANLMDYHTIEPDGSPRVNLSGTTREQMYALAKIGFKEDGLTGEGVGGEALATGKREVRIELDGRLTALRLLGQELGMFKEKKELHITGVPVKRVVMVGAADAANDDEFTPAEDSEEPVE